MASAARSRATADKRLATRLTARNVNSATQFCGSAIVNVWTGGRKKKLNATIAAIDVATATHKRDEAATNKTTSKYDNATVVAFVSSPTRYVSVTAVSPARPRKK